MACMTVLLGREARGSSRACWHDPPSALPFARSARSALSGRSARRLSSRRMTNVLRRSIEASLPVAVRAEGSTIWDADGRSYLDAAGGAIVVGVGHGRESIARVMAEQAALVAYAHGTAFTSEPLERYAAAL